MLLQSFINDQNKQQILEMVCLYSQFFDFEILTILAKNKVNFNHYFVNHQTFQSTDLLFSLLRYQFDQDLLQKSVFFLLKNYNFYLNHQYDYWPAPNFQTHSTKLNLLTLAFIKNQEKVFDYLLFLQANPFDQDCSTFKYVSRNISFSKKDYLLKLIDHQLIFENFHLIEDLLKENLPLTSQQILQSFYERSQIHQQIKNSINCSDTLVLQKI